jgi:drug/metabolite transporter (DMT)-like permease
MMTAQALFASMAMGARFVSRDVPWQEIAAARMVVALVLTWGIARARGRSLVLVDRRHAWLRAVFGTLSAAGTFYVYAQPRLPIGDAVTVLGTSPIFVAIFAWALLGERVSGSTALAVLTSFAGVWAVAAPSFHASSAVLGVCVFASVCSALAMTWLRRIGPGESSEAIVFHFMSVATAALGLAAIPVWSTPDLRSATFLLLMGAAGGLGQLAMTRAYSLDQAARVSGFSYAGVVFARLLALASFGEVPRAAQVLGSLLVVGAGVAMAWRSRMDVIGARDGDAGSVRRSGP